MFPESCKFIQKRSRRRRSNPAMSREYEIDGLVILRAIAKHLCGPHGFLTEGVDWRDVEGNVVLRQASI